MRFSAETFFVLAVVLVCLAESGWSSVHNSSDAQCWINGECIGPVIHIKQTILTR
jgi:hypothetical protein